MKWTAGMKSARSLAEFMHKLSRLWRNTFVQSMIKNLCITCGILLLCYQHDNYVSLESFPDSDFFHHDESNDVLKIKL